MGYPDPGYPMSTNVDQNESVPERVLARVWLR